MISNEVGGQLHDRATRGEPLTPAEQSQLETWYAEQDALESELLRSTTTYSQVSQLQTQVDAALAQLATTTQRIQKTTADNESLRCEIDLLRQQLSSAIP